MKDLKAIRFFYDGKKKVSHDLIGKNIEYFSYQDLVSRNLEGIGIHGKINNIIIIDIDVPSDTHKYDGRAWWTKFATENDLEPTYTVSTRSGGFHYYYYLPDHVNPDTFQAPATLSKGVDVKWNGWVAAPPSEGYDVIHGSHDTIADAPKALLDVMMLRKTMGHDTAHEISYEEGMTLQLPKPFTPKQIKQLRNHLEWMQVNAELSREEWRNGLFALKAGLNDDAILQEFVEKWTYNRNYSDGDENQAQGIIDRADKYGSVGPGTIFAIIKDIRLRQGAVIESVDMTPQEVRERSGVEIKVNDDGGLSCIASETNISAIISALFTVEELYLDSRKDVAVFKGREVDSKDLLHTVMPIIQCKRTGLGLEKITKNIIIGALDVLLHHRRKDPHVIWLKSLEWDQVPRIDSFFSKYVGADASEYITAVSKNFWIALCARAMRPGCKFDHIVVLEGKEGIRKSSMIEAIAGEYTYAPSTKRSLEQPEDLKKMHQSIIVELPEMMGLIGEDANVVKAFLSKSRDSMRKLYRESANTAKRGFIFVGTTNDSKYLSFDMGARRFWPVRITRDGHIDTNAILMDREQLFAEAMERLANGESYHEVPEAEHNAIAKSRVTKTPMYHVLYAHLLGREEITMAELVSELRITGSIATDISPAVAKKLYDSLKIIGFHESADGIWTRMKVELGSFL